MMVNELNSSSPLLLERKYSFHPFLAPEIFPKYIFFRNYKHLIICQN